MTTAEQLDIQHARATIEDALARLGAVSPEAARYLRAHLEFDEAHGVVRFTGDSRPDAVAPKRRGRGRPSFMDDAEVVAGHVPMALRDAFIARCEAEGITVAEGLRRAIAAWLGGAS